MGEEDAPAFNNPELVHTLAAGSTHFALDLFKRVCRPDENALLCPIGISSILGMALLGARGDTASQLKETMRLTGFEEDEQVHVAFQDILSTLPQDDQEQGVSLFSANSLFLQEDLQVSDEFRELLEQHYSNEVQKADFAQAADETRNSINSLVAEKTGDKFKEFICDGQVDMFTVLLLASAVYFRGEWANKFEKLATKLTPFQAGGGRKAMVDMMHQHGLFLTGESEDLQCKLIDLPYVGGRLSMTIFLPNDAEGLTTLEDQLDADKLTEVLESLSEASVAVTLPRFHVECSFSLSDILSELGSTDLFNQDSADLSGLCEGEGVFASSVLHRSLVEVGERGSECAASLSASVEYEEPECTEDEVQFVVDHPFLFLIRDNASQMILFIGRMQYPATEELIP